MLKSKTLGPFGLRRLGSGCLEILKDGTMLKCAIIEKVD